MGFIAVIPARGGSKGILGKNLAPCNGHPLIHYTFKAAQESKKIDEVLLSTDDQRIAQFGRESSISVPYMRRPELATDEAPMIGVLQEALDWMMSSGKNPEGIVLLQPTSPLRTARHIDEAIEVFRKTGAQTVVSVVEVPHRFHPVSLMKLAAEGPISPYIAVSAPPLRRQDKPKIYARNGPAIVIVKPEILRSGQLYGERTFPYFMEDTASIDVDSQTDLRVAELFLRSLPAE